MDGGAEVSYMEDKQNTSDWGVWSWEDGVFYSVEPPTRENAINEAILAESSPRGRVLHEAVTVREGILMANATAWARVKYVEADRG